MKKIKKHIKHVNKEMRNNIAKTISAAFAFIMALVWRDAIKEAVDKVVGVIGITGTGYIYQILTAIVISIICVIGIIVVSKSVK